MTIDSPASRTILPKTKGARPVRSRTTKVRAAVVGLGWPGMQHLKGYTADPRSEVIAVCDLDETHAKEVATQHNIPNIYTNHLEMLENKDN